MRFNNRGILGKTILDFSQRSRRIVIEPPRFRQQDLGLSKSRVLLSHIFQHFKCFNELLGRTRTVDLGFEAAVNKVLLCQLHQEVSVEPNVELHVVGGSLRLRHVKVQAGVKHAHCFDLVAFETPLDHGLEVAVVSGLGLLIIFAKLSQKFELLGGVLDLLLPDTAEDHPVQWSQQAVIILSRSLKNLVSANKVTHQRFLVADFSVIESILRAVHQGNVQNLECLVEHHFFAAAVASQQPRNVKVKIGILALNRF